MKTISIIAAVAALAVSAPAFAKGHNPGEARGMASFLKGGGGGNDSVAKTLLGVEDQNGGVARFVSGKNAPGGKGNGGWGNIGSLVTGPDGANVSEDGTLEFDDLSVSGR